MPLNYVNYFFSNEGTRNEVRMRVINLFSQENPGCGTGNLASNYIYFVENLISGNRIYLKRPAFLHNGFDFLICVENFIFSKNRNNPSFDDILSDLSNKKNNIFFNYQYLYNILYKIYNCNNIDDRDINNIQYNIGFPIDLVVKTIKWFFIEQDIRYWNYSGRNKLWMKINTL